MKYICTSLLIATLVGTGVGHAEDTLSIGHPTLRGAVLTTGTVTIESVKLLQDLRTPLNEALQSITATVIAGLSVYHITNIHHSADGDSTVTNIHIRQDDLSLVSHTVRARNDSASVLYADGFLTGWVVLPDKPVQLIARQIGHRVFPVDGPAPWLLSALPLSEGFKATIARYSMWKDAETHETVRVIGSEMLERNGNRTDCWKIDCGPFAIPGYRAYRWVEKESGIILQGALLGKKDEPEYWSFSTIR